MSTTALVGILQQDGRIKYRRVNHDGYLEGLGIILLERYNTPEDVIKLQTPGENREESILCGIYTADSERDFITSHPFHDYQYLYKDGNWYYGDWWYDDGCVRDINTGEILRRERPPKLYENNKEWKLLKDQFIITERVIRDYKLIEN